MASLFGTVDFVLFGAVLLFSLATGVYHSRKQNSSSKFILGNRKMSAFPVGVSLMVSFQSAIMMLGVPAEVYFYSAQWIFGVLGSVIGRFLSSAFVIPFVYPLRLTSANTILYMGIALYAPAIAIEAVMGFQYWVSMLCVTIAAVVYTSMGGIKAVIWTDVLQAVIMYVGMIVFVIKGTMAVGGFSYVWEVNKQNGRLNVFQFDLDPTVRHTFWGLMMGEIINGFFNAFSQSTVQRISSIPTLKGAQRSYYFTAMTFLVILTIAVVEGLVVFAYYFKIRCDPFQSNKINNINQILPFMVVDIFQGIPGLPGLFLAAIISAALSTISTGLTTSSSLAWEDLIKPCFKNFPERRAVFFNRICVIVFGVAAIGLSFLMSNITGSLSQITRLITSSMAGSLEAVFALGCICPWANKYGAAVGGIISATLLSWVTLGQLLSDDVRKTPFLAPAPVDGCYVNDSFAISTNQTANMWNYTVSLAYATAEPDIVIPVSGFPVSGLNAIYSLSYKWMGTACMIIVITVGSIVSLITGRTKPGEVDSNYIYPVFDRFFCCCSSFARRLLPCCVPYHRERAEQVNGDVEMVESVVLDILYNNYDDKTKLGDNSGEGQHANTTDNFAEGQQTRTTVEQ